MDFVIFALFTIVGLQQICRSTQEITASQEEQTRLLDMLLDKYDSRIRPSGKSLTDEAVLVAVGIDLHAVTAVSDYDQDFGVRVTLTQEWSDPRLMYDSKEGLRYITLTDPSRIWTPDLYFTNEKEADLHKLMNTNSFVRIHPSGLVHFRSRISLSLWCKMQLERFPFDSQLCNIQMASYGYTADDLRLVWRNVTPVTEPDVHHVDTLGFTLLGVKAIPSDDFHNTVEVKVVFQRDLKYYTLHTFLPSVVVVAVSWLSLWVDHTAMVTRVLINLATLLAMGSLTAEVEAAVPHVPYLKAMDLWTGACFTFLLASLVNSITTDNPRADGPQEKVTNDDMAGEKTSTYQGLFSNIHRHPKHIESLARLLLPLLFGVFAALYFIVQCVFYGSVSLE